jgi:ABC-type multidrug transport system fused ATPase/permease subunit
LNAANSVNASNAAPRLRELIPMMWSRLGSRRLIFIIAIILCMSEMVINMLVPVLLETFFNNLESGELANIRRLCIVSTAIVIGLLALGLVGHYLKQNTMSSLHREVTLELADHAQRLPLTTAQASHTADLAQRIQHDSNKTSWLLATLFHGMGTQVVMLLLAAVYMLRLQWQIALTILILMPLGLLASHLLRHRLRDIGRRVADQEAVVKQCQQDALQGMETIRAFGAEGWMTERFVRQRQMLNELYIRRMWWQQIVNALSTSFALMINWGSILFAAWLAIEGQLQVGALMAFFILVWRIFNPLLNLGRMWGEMQENLGASVRVFAVWQADKEPQGRNAAAAGFSMMNAQHDAAVSWQDVSYRYPENCGLQQAGNNVVATSADAVTDPSEEAQPLLTHFNLTLLPGSFTALVGPSGSGKSTAAKIGAGLLIPDEGSVRIHDQSPQIDAENARRLVAYVPQTPYLFSGSIRDNLLTAQPDASEAELTAASQAAEAHDFILSLPQGYDTLLKEHGDSLSGGQKQRIAIARAMLADRPVWILDEATSALDLETERRVMEAILRRTREQGRTLLVIAHRLTTIQDADRIIAMENGIIREQGTHRQLMNNYDGLYRSLWQISAS